MIPGGMLSSMYMDWLERHPLLTKSLTASSISLLSNLVSQTTSGQQQPPEVPQKGRCQRKYNRRELLKYLLFGLHDAEALQSVVERVATRCS